jgi:hypothetical protein
MWKATVLAMTSLVLLVGARQSLAADPVPIGRWEIVHTTGDSSAQTYAGGFSTYLTAGGTGYTFGTIANSVCVINGEHFNVVPSWTALPEANMFQITITVDNLGLGPNVSFVYIGTYNPITPVPGSSGKTIPAITGIYYPIGDASACSVDIRNDAPGQFVATFFPTISSGSAIGSLDDLSADNGSPFDLAVTATVNFTPPPAPGQIAGSVSLASNPTVHGTPCFATSGDVVNPLAINSVTSSQPGVTEYAFADGFDPSGVPSTLYLNGISVNLYSPTPPIANNAVQVTSTQWAIAAAIGEDDPAAGPSAVDNDGTNTDILFFYGVIGGVCDGAGGIDAPFHFIPGNPVAHKRTPIGRKRVPQHPRDTHEKESSNRRTLAGQLNW